MQFKLKMYEYDIIIGDKSLQDVLSDSQKCSLGGSMCSKLTEVKEIGHCC